MTIRLTLPPLTFAALFAASFSAAHAQEPLLSADPMAQARAAMARNDPAEALSRYLRVLAARPKDLDALMGAGRAALDIGDPSAAVGFYARAEEIAPRNGWVKAGLGSAMVQMENPRAALKLFDEATDLDVPVADIAADRGLAYDLRGDNKRAQQDYALALRTGEDNETRRRMALSQRHAPDPPPCEDRHERFETWVDPLTSAKQRLPGRIPNTAAYTFTPPESGEDWALLLQR